MQTSLKLLLWARLMYQYDEVSSEPAPMFLTASCSSNSSHLTQACCRFPSWHLHASTCMRTAVDKHTTLTQVPKPTVTLEAAMKLYGLTSFELLWEQERDTKALLAWSDDTIVLAFRGTASLRNVIADIQA